MENTSFDNKVLAERFALALKKLPLVAILRGIKPEEAEAIGQGLYEAGFRLIEVPLNSPDPFASIAAIRRCVPMDALVGVVGAESAGPGGRHHPRRLQPSRKPRRAHA